MIREPNAQAAIDLAEELDRRNLGVCFKEDSPLLSMHTAATVDFAKPRLGVAPGYTPTAFDVCAESAVVPMGCERSVHDEALDDAVLVIADAVRQHVSFAKNTVRPLIKTLVDRLEVALKAMPTEATYNPTIERVELPEPMRSNVFESLVEEYVNATQLPNVGPLDLPARDAAAVSAMLVTGNKLMDGDIAIWAQRMGDAFFEDVWANVFTRAGGATPKTFAQLVDDKETGVDASLAIFLLARACMDNVPEGVVAALDAYRRDVGEVMEQAGVCLVQAIQRTRMFESTGMMVLSANKDRVRVIASVYDQWLENGGNVAALFGSMLSGRPRYHAGAITEEATDNIARWERENRLMTDTLRNRRFSDTLALIEFKTLQLIDENCQAIFGPVLDDQPVDPSSPVVDEAVQAVRDYIATLKFEDVENLWCVCTQLVAGKLFSYTDALRILEGLDEAARINPDLTPNEAALQSTISYVVDYVFDQLHVHEL